MGRVQFDDVRIMTIYQYANGVILDDGNGSEPLTIETLLDFLNQFPPDSVVYAYAGEEDIGIIVLSAERDELGRKNLTGRG